ncbi:hypothetical protein H8B13_12100 [Hymenobacter sp. BT188]|nr:hypothetical protein [Hymenobacter sp. BT188]MBC6607562.1 hypothetical protein [Hymenobacter sp. BT188]
MRSGLSGQASKPHAANSEKFDQRIAGDNMESGTGMTAPSDKGSSNNN